MHHETKMWTETLNIALQHTWWSKTPQDNYNRSVCFKQSACWVGKQRLQAKRTGCLKMLLLSPFEPLLPLCPSPWLQAYQHYGSCRFSIWALKQEGLNWGQPVHVECGLRDTWRLAVGTVTCFSPGDPVSLTEYHPLRALGKEHYIYIKSCPTLVYVSPLDPQPSAVKWSENKPAEMSLYGEVRFERSAGRAFAEPVPMRASEDKQKRLRDRWV